MLTLLFAAVLATSCSKNSDGDSEDVVATGVSIDQQALALAIEQTITLKATVSPEDANDRSVTWSSSDETVATVSQEGEVTTHKAGTVTIIATSNSGGYTATCAVTVSNEIYVAVTSVSINKGTLNLAVGAKETLTATVKPKNATTKNVTWASQDNAIATVSATGEVTAVALGTTVISVVTLDGDNSDVCEVIVQEAVVGGPGFQNEGTAGIDGSSWEKAYEIADNEQLILLSTRVNADYTKWGTKYYKLTNDIYLGNISIAPWIPISNPLGFGGHFDGKNYTIYGRLQAASTATDFGLFGYVKNGEIKNVNIETDIKISAMTKTDASIGAIAGQCNNSTITNCTNLHPISGKGMIGGIVGSISGNTKVIACQNEGDMTSENSSVGGIVGNGNSGLIVGCINRGATMTVANPTDGAEYAGGIAGIGKPVACWSVATTFTGNSKRIGGIVGHLYSNQTDLVSSNCHWLSIDGVEGIGSGAGKEKNYYAFTGVITLQMASDMNKAWLALIPDTKFGFNENGSIISFQ